VSPRWMNARNVVSIMDECHMSLIFSVSGSSGGAFKRKVCITPEDRTSGVTWHFGLRHFGSSADRIFRISTLLSDLHVSMTSLSLTCPHEESDMCHPEMGR
jgi:hypothetical protein